MFWSVYSQKTRCLHGELLREREMPQGPAALQAGELGWWELCGLQRAALSQQGARHSAPDPHRTIR